MCMCCGCRLELDYCFKFQSNDKSLHLEKTILDETLFIIIFCSFFEIRISHA